MAGIDAFGTVFARGDGADPEQFTALANATSIGGPGISRETLDVTAHDSPDQWMEFVGGLKDGGEVSIDINYDPSVHDAILDDLDTSDPINYRLTFPDPAATAWTVPALLTGFEPDAPYDDKLAASLTFKVAGKPSFGA